MAIVRGGRGRLWFALSCKPSNLQSKLKENDTVMASRGRALKNVNENNRSKIEVRTYSSVSLLSSWTLNLYKSAGSYKEVVPTISIIL